MPSPSVLALALSVSAVLAAPSFPAALRKRGTDGCGPTLNNPTFGDEPFAADIGYYSDKDCTEKIDYLCLYAPSGTLNGDKGDYACASALLPPTTPFWAKVEDSPYDEMQVVFTRDQTCPPNGPGAVFATLIDNASCVQMNLGGFAPGVTIFPHGGSGIARVAATDEEASQAASKRSGSLGKRAAKCSGFSYTDSQPSSSQTVQVSNIVDCTNGGDAGCSITIGSEHTESVSTSYSVSAGGGIEGIFSVEATFGQEYTSSSTTSIQEGFSVQPGQKGYLAAYSAATLFKGKFTGCDSGDAEQPGQALVIKKEGFTYNVVNTGS